MLTFVVDPLPADVVQKRELCSLQEMFDILHAPTSFAALDRARHRLYVMKLLQRQLNALITKQTYQQHLSTSSPDRQIVRELLEHIPFALTNAQKRVTKEIIEELHGPVTMMKLLQGDVGSGKTIVAALAAWYIIKHR